MWDFLSKAATKKNLDRTSPPRHTCRVNASKCFRRIRRSLVRMMDEISELTSLQCSAPLVTSLRKRYVAP